MRYAVVDVWRAKVVRLVEAGGIEDALSEVGARIVEGRWVEVRESGRDTVPKLFGAKYVVIPVSDLVKRNGLPSYLRVENYIEEFLEDGLKVASVAQPAIKGLSSTAQLSGKICRGNSVASTCIFVSLSGCVVDGASLVFVATQGMCVAPVVVTSWIAPVIVALMSRDQLEVLEEGLEIARSVPGLEIVARLVGAAMSIGKRLRSYISSAAELVHVADTPFLCRDAVCLRAALRAEIWIRFVDEAEPHKLVINHVCPELRLYARYVRGAVVTERGEAFRAVIDITTSGRLEEALNAVGKTVLSDAIPRDAVAIYRDIEPAITLAGRMYVREIERALEQEGIVVPV